MRLDLLKTGDCDRSKAGTTYYAMVRGSLSSLLLINTATWHFKDTITIKLRHEGGLMTIVDRVSALRLAILCDLKQGMPTTGTPDYVGAADGSNDDNGGYVQINAGVKFYENAFELPLGHISLSGAQQLEITVDTAAGAADSNGKYATGTVQISSVQRKTRLDTILTYDVSNDLEANQYNVREIYLCGKNNVSFFTTKAGAPYGLPQANDIRVKLGIDGDDSENSLEAYSALTAITGNLTYMPNSVIRIFQDMDSLPAATYIKVSGNDKGTAEILYVRETQVAHMIGESISSGLDKEIKRVELLENNEPERAAALIQTGTIASSATLKDASDKLIPAVSAPIR